MASHNDDVDAETAALIARLVLDDLEELESSRKGKARYDVPLDDQAIALRLQAENLEAYLRALEDFEFARSLDHALDTDHVFLAALSAVARGEEDDHQAALALSRGLPLPPPSRWQQALVVPLPAEPGTSSRADDSSDEEEETVISGQTTPSAALNPNKLANKLSTSGVSKMLECVICRDACSKNSSFHAPCDHYYCRPCLRDLVETSTHDESLYPLKCCRQNLPTQQITAFLQSDHQLLTLFQAKSAEFGTPSDRRVYCPVPTCSAFLGPSQGVHMICRRCATIVCTSCKNQAHWGESCAVSTSALQLQALATTNRWQTCPTCKSIVELNTGCFHITCRCRAEFCYLCAVPWKNCVCRQWDEHHLIDAAEQRVINEFGRRAAVAAPELHAQRVQQRVDLLRTNHHCAHYNWQYRRGGGTCESCGFYLREFLLRCVGCQMLACVRCRRNRL